MEKYISSCSWPYRPPSLHLINSSMFNCSRNPHSSASLLISPRWSSFSSCFFNIALCKVVLTLATPLLASSSPPVPLVPALASLCFQLSTVSHFVPLFTLHFIIRLNPVCLIVIAWVLSLAPKQAGRLWCDIRDIGGGALSVVSRHQLQAFPFRYAVDKQFCQLTVSEIKKSVNL